MTSDPTPRRSIFAVWHWPRWVWAVMVPLVFVAYFLSAGPVWACVERLWNDGRVSQDVFDATLRFYTPAWWIADRSEALRNFVDWEERKTAALLWEMFPIPESE